MSTPIRYTNGVTNVAKGNTMGEFGAPDRTKYLEYFNDFFTYAATDWVLTTVEDGASDATEACSNSQNGALLVTNDAADNDSDFFQLSYNGGTNVLENFKFASGKKTWFKIRFQASEATQIDLIAGLYIADTTPIASAPSDGVFFRKDDGSTNIDIVSAKNSAESTAVVGTLAAATNTILGFYWDGSSRLYYYLNDVEIGYIEPSTNLPDDEELAVSFGVQNGSANARTMTVDYIWAVQER